MCSNNVPKLSQMLFPRGRTLFGGRTFLENLHIPTVKVYLILTSCLLVLVPCNSLWGKVGDFSRCSHWRLNPQVSIPALQELTVCLNLKVKVLMRNKMREKQCCYESLVWTKAHLTFRLNLLPYYQQQSSCTDILLLSMLSWAWA